ncbi:MAG: hypothetical protein ACOY46_14745 [Bacillota bacterium]
MKYFTLVGILTTALAGNCQKEQNISEKQEFGKILQHPVGCATDNLPADCSSDRVNFKRVSGK